MERKKERNSLEKIRKKPLASELPRLRGLRGGIDDSKYSCVESNTLCGLGTRASACPAGARSLPRSSHADFPRAPTWVSGVRCSHSESHTPHTPAHFTLPLVPRPLDRIKQAGGSFLCCRKSIACPSLLDGGRPPTAAAAPCRHRSLPLMPRPAQSGGSSASPARPGLRGRGPPAA